MRIQPVVHMINYGRSMAKRGIDFDSVHYGELVGVLRESDDVGVLLRGHLWIEALLEYAVRGELKRPDAFGWGGARFEHKLALADAIGVVTPEQASALRGFNGLRNKISHELVYELDANEIKTFIGRLDEKDRQEVARLADSQLEVLREIERAHADGHEVEIAEDAKRYIQILTEARAYLFAFVAWMARYLAFSAAFSATQAGTEPTAMLEQIDATISRLTGGLFSFRKAPKAPPSA